VLPPGLYEATFEAKSADAANAELAGGKWIMRCEPRALDDIRPWAAMPPKMNDALRLRSGIRDQPRQLPEFRAAVAPRAVPSPLAEWMRKWHPLRVS